MSAENRIISLVGVERLLELSGEGAALSFERKPRVLDYAPGDRIAHRYQLVRLIGKGGMGVVWEAHSEVLDIRVAIKLIHLTASNDEDKLRLIREAKTVARLSDPAVVRVFDCGETLNGEPYVVMELLAGQDLATRLEERGCLGPVEAVRTLLPIIRALGAAHDAGIVHRDVKPENVYLTKSATGEEQPKLLDFGIAKVEMPAEQRLTHLGSALGSPYYMSPEQARGEDVDRRTDLWGACVVLYEAIIGQLPFQGDGYNAVLYAVLSAEVSSFQQMSVDEPELWAIVSRGLERDRDLRWQTSAELVDALSQWLIARGVLHDLAGVSLHASPNRATLKSVRPAQVADGIDQETLARETTGPHGVARPRAKWLISALSTLFLAIALLVLWRVIRHPTESRAVSFPAAAATTSRAVQPIAPVLGVESTPEPVAEPPSNAKPLRPPPEPKPATRLQPAATENEPFKDPFQ